MDPFPDDGKGDMGKKKMINGFTVDITFLSSLLLLMDRKPGPFERKMKALSQLGSFPVGPMPKSIKSIYCLYVHRDSGSKVGDQCCKQLTWQQPK